MFGEHGGQCDHCCYLERIIIEQLADIREMIRMTQADVDAETAAVNAEAASNAAAFLNIQAEIATLEAAGTPNLDGLKAAVAALQGSDASIATLETPTA